MYEETDGDRGDHDGFGIVDWETRRARVLSTPCATCVTFPDDRMHLGARRTEFIQDVIDRGSYVICHDTIGEVEAVCRGYWNLHRGSCTLLGFLEHQGWITEVEPPVEKD